MTHASTSPTVLRLVAATLALLLAGYLVAAIFGWPQRGRDLVVSAEHGEVGHHAAPQTPPPYYAVVPFVLLLGSIAVLPMLRATEHWWESNLHRFYVAGGLALLTLLYYAVDHRGSIEGHWPAHHVVEHPADGGLQLHLPWTVFANAILGEYIPFIVLLFSLYTISGGIRIEGDLAARPLTNTAFMAVGGLLASFIGTTGAAMLLIRPLLETNRERKHIAHTVVFFIFIVCNCGGCLLPLGDPPLFLGYLRGVDFLWTLHLWKEWLFVNGALLVIYFLWDHFYHYAREEKRDIAADEARVRGLTISGWHLNGLLLLGVVLCVALLDSSKPLPGTSWHPWMFLREAALLALVGISLFFGPVMVRQKNRFTFAAIIEVAALFLGIFICMQPALQILNLKGPDLPLTTATRFFWATGSLSAVLDNAPTYVVFFETAKTVSGPNDLPVGVGTINQALLTAISLGAVFMGAMTYIGNGPNFMVKAIAETSGIRMPSFFGYLKYSFGILVPLFILVNVLFF